MPITKADIIAMTMAERMELIDLIWDVTNDEHPEWVDDRNADELLADEEETHNDKSSSAS